MIHLLLDTNILRSEGLNSRNLLMLRRLVQAGHVRLFVPDIVKREFISHRYAEAEQATKEIVRSVQNLERMVDSNRQIHPDLRASRILCIQNGKGMHREIDLAFEDWARSSSVEILPIDPTDGLAVLDDYFDGSGAFSHIKARKDFPDAFVQKAAARLIEAKGNISILVADGHFSKSLAAMKSATMFPSVTAFLEQEQMAAFVAELDQAEEQVQEHLMWLKSRNFSELIKGYISQSEQSDYLYLEEKDIEGKEAMLFPIWAESVEGLNSPLSNIKVSDAVMLYKDTYSVKFRFSAQSTLRYCASYAHWEDIEGASEGEADFISMNGDGVVEVGENREVEFYGYLDIFIEESDGLDSFKTQLRDILRGESPAYIDINYTGAKIYE